MMRLYLIRHADPDYEHDTITPTGHLEAAALAGRMKSIGLDRIYSSPLGRAKATAKYTADALGMQSRIEEWSCEISGCHYHNGDQTLAVWNTPGEIIRAKKPAPTELTWGQIDPESGAIVKEKFQTLQQCSDRFIAGLGYERQGGLFRIRESNRMKVALFCHNGTISFLLSQLLEIPLSLVWCGFWQAPSSVTTILFEERSKDWAVPRALSVGDTSQLYAAGLQAQPRGIIANYE